MITLEQLLKYSKEHPEGFTIDKEGNPVTEGFAVAIKATKYHYGEYGAWRVLDEISNGPHSYSYIGGWKESHEIFMWYDAIIIAHDYDIAVALAKKHEQKAFYDLTNNILNTFK